MCRVWKLSFSEKQLYSFTLCFSRKEEIVCSILWSSLLL